MLTHTSGIADDAEEENGENYSALFTNTPNYAIRNNADFLKNFAYKKPNFKAGTNVRYNNCAFILLGLAIEKLTGHGYREFITENIFKPFGMNNTKFNVMDDICINVAEGYYLSDNTQGKSIWKKNIYSFPSIGAADSGAYTTVNDLDIFIKKIKCTPIFEKMLYPQYEFIRCGTFGNIRYGYAFEFVVKDDKVFSIFKQGCNVGVCNMFCYYPEQDITFTILANQDCNVWKLHKQVQDIIIEK